MLGIEGGQAAVRREILDLPRRIRERGNVKAGGLLASRFKLIELLGHGGLRPSGKPSTNSAGSWWPPKCSTRRPRGTARAADRARAAFRDYGNPALDVEDRGFRVMLPAVPERIER